MKHITPEVKIKQQNVIKVCFISYQKYHIVFNKMYDNIFILS